MNHSYSFLANEVIIANHLTIGSNGSLQNITNFSFSLSLTGNFTIESGGRIIGNVNITAVNISLNNGSLINASGLGYGGASGAAGSNGDGPGGGVGGATAGGGGYGGKGGDATGVGGQPYGSVFTPIDKGSGGGGDTARDHGFQHA